MGFKALVEEAGGVIEQCNITNCRIQKSSGVVPEGFVPERVVAAAGGITDKCLIRRCVCIRLHGCILFRGMNKVASFTVSGCNSAPMSLRSRHEESRVALNRPQA
jgi:hypothetical protein